MSGLDNVLGRTREDQGDRWVFQFANGLEVHTDAFMKSSPERVLPLGGPQDTLLNRLVHFPDTVSGKRIFDPFAGSGIFGLMSLQLGAAHVDFLDINPRASEFQEANAARNGFPADRYEIHRRDIADFRPTEPFDIVLANPPFVPTPPGIPGTLTSAGGSEGSDLVEILLSQLDRLLRPDGQAFVYVMQFVSDSGPLLTNTLLEHIPERTAELTPTQVEAISLGDYCDAYRQCFTGHHPEIDRWQAALQERHGTLGVQHYVMHIGARRPGDARWTLMDDLVEKYGIDPYAVALNKDLALGRVMENVVFDP